MTTTGKGNGRGQSSASTLAIDQIRIGSRFRNDLGDIVSLAASIERIGLLQPIAVNEQHELIDGFRRIAAFKQLGRARIPVYVVNLEKLLLGERDANFLHKPFTPMEMAAIGEALEVHIAEQARERELSGKGADGSGGRGHKKKPSGKLPEGLGDTRDKVAAALGISGRQYDKIKAVANEGGARLAEEMDKTGNVDRAYRAMCRREAEKNKPRTPAFPEKKYQCIVIDPPWPVEKIERECRPNQNVTLDYSTMTIDEIAGLPISTLANPGGCHVYLWVTHKFLPTGLELFKLWGVKYQCVLTWVKPTGMTPYSFQYNTEHVLFGRIGNLKLDKNGEKLSFAAPSERHSHKPVEFYNLVRKVSPEPRLDMFARDKKAGFDAWGNECENNSSGAALTSKAAEQAQEEAVN